MKKILPYLLALGIALSWYIAFLAGKYEEYIFQSAPDFDLACKMTSQIVAENEETITREYTLSMENIAKRKLYVYDIYFGIPSKQGYLSDPVSFSVKNLIPTKWKHTWLETYDPFLTFKQKVTFARDEDIENPHFFVEYTKRLKKYPHHCQ